MPTSCGSGDMSVWRLVFGLQTPKLGEAVRINSQGKPLLVHASCSIVMHAPQINSNSVSAHIAYIINSCAAPACRTHHHQRQNESRCLPHAAAPILNQTLSW